MKKVLSAAMAACVAVAGFTIQPARADSADAQAEPATPAQASSAPMGARPEVEKAIHDAWLRRANVDPGSNKAKIIDKWSQKIRLEGASPVGGGIPLNIQNVMDNPELRKPFILGGLARISPEDRLEYYQMASSFFDRFVPDDCFGMTDPQQVMAKAMSIDKMSDAEADEFFGLIYKMVHASAIHAPIDVPSASAHTAAVKKLGFAMEALVPNDKADIDRFAAFVVDPSHVSLRDKCWMTGLSMHAILSMSEPDRDIILRYTFAVVATQAQPGAAQNGPAVATPGRQQTSAGQRGFSKL
ncbi:hypothetical protein ACLKMY_24830 [Paraburkholderia mimosarum]|uniref:hypothetical protein n=1 Tax=Paraburkholderia mimosarum TaxID=312026 RepID=UPI0039C41AA0